MSEESNIVGNISTGIKYVSMLIAGWTISVMVGLGFNLHGLEEQITEALTMIIFFALAHIDAKNPNTIFNEETVEACKVFVDGQHVGDASAIHFKGGDTEDTADVEVDMQFEGDNDGA